MSKELPLTAMMWSFLSGVQAALNFFARFNIEDWAPMGPTHHRRGLSDRQIAILRLVPLGLTNEAIAYRLGFSASTIKVDLSRAMETLRVNDRHRAAAAAEQWIPHDNATV
jgi:DNA-binding NarL/FixJ family response regulator